jgi:hypothetical protein
MVGVNPALGRPDVTTIGKCSRHCVPGGGAGSANLAQSSRQQSDMVTTKSAVLSQTIALRNDSTGCFGIECRASTDEPDRDCMTDAWKGKMLRSVTKRSHALVAVLCLAGSSARAQSAATLLQVVPALASTFAGPGLSHNGAITVWKSNKPTDICVTIWTCSGAPSCVSSVELHPSGLSDSATTVYQHVSVCASAQTSVVVTTTAPSGTGDWVTPWRIDHLD